MAISVSSLSPGGTLSATLEICVKAIDYARRIDSCYPLSRLRPHKLVIDEQTNWLFILSAIWRSEVNEEVGHGAGGDAERSCQYACLKRLLSAKECGC